MGEATKVGTVGRILLVLFIPIVWGLASAWAFEKLRLRRQRRARSRDSSNGEKLG